MTAARTSFVMYGLQLSWYSAKLRPYLQYKGIPFVERVPSLVTIYHRIARRVGNPTIPVLVTPEGEWLQDTSLIVERLEQRFPAAPVVPRAPRQRFAAHLLELWADEFWHSSAVYTRWRYPENYPRWEAEMGRALAPALPRAVGRRLARIPRRQQLEHLPRLGATPHQVAQIERWTSAQCAALDAHFATLPFLFGTRPSIADFALVGPLYGHLGRDAGSARVYLDPCPQLSAWLARMNCLAPREDAFLPGDELPATLAPLLRSVFDEMLPYLEATADRVGAWLPRLRRGERLPRFVEAVRFPFAGAPFERQGMPYTLWMAQRALDLLPQMAEHDEHAVREWLGAIGGDALLQLRIPRLRRVGLQAAPEWTAP